MNTKYTARAIVYAARQAFMINAFGMRWEEIEINTANILQGCSVPADGKMNSAEAVQAAIMGNTYTGPLVEPVSPGSVEERVALELVDKYHAAKQELANVREALRIESAAAIQARNDAQNQRNHMLLRLRERDDSIKVLDAVREDLKTTDARCTELGAELVNARAAAEQLRKDNAALRGTRDPALQAELELTQRARDTWRDKAMNTARERNADTARNKELEERNVELRQQLENLGNELARTVCDRDGFRRGAQFWMDSSKDRQAERDKAEVKVVKLRTYLESYLRYPAGGGEVTRLLEETK